MRWKKWMKFSLLLIFIWVLIHTVIIVADGFHNDNCKNEFCVILGSKVNMDSTLSDRLKARLDKGVELFVNGNIKKIIVSGGFGEEGFFEGDMMKEYLISCNIPDTLIIADNFGNSTNSSAINAFQICDSLKQYDITIISQYFHLTRAKMLFRKAGFETICAASPVYFEFRDIYSVMREFVSFYWSLI